MRIFRVMILFYLFLLGPSPVPALSAATDESKRSIPDDFLGLADLRSTLTVEISTLEKEVQELQAVIESEGDQLRRQGELQSTIDSLRKESDRNEEILGFLEREKEKLANDLQAIQRARDSLAEKRASLQERRQLAVQIEDKIASLLSPEHAFKRWMSFVFAFLILCVIVGFFVLAFRDRTIRQAIFAGQAGLQFVTLFSVVIAIILFGITGILEGRELGPLLAGLSGYILGSRTKNRERPPAAETDRSRD